MSKNHHLKNIENKAEDLTSIQENLNELRIEKDEPGVEEAKGDQDNPDNSVNDLTDIENDDPEIEKINHDGAYTTSDLQEKWIETDMETLQKYLSGDAMMTIEEKINQIKANILPIDILSAESLEQKFPLFPPEFYEYFEIASRKRFEILLKEEKEKPIIKEGEFELKF